MPAEQAEAKLRWYHLTPGRLLFLLLPVEGILLLLNWLEKTPKGWAVLIAIASVGVGLLLLLGWFVLALVFRWRFQYSLRSLMVLMVAVAIPFSWLAVEISKARVQRKIVKMASSVRYEYQQKRLPTPFDFPLEVTYPLESTWLWNLLGKDFFASVTIIDNDISKPPPFTDNDLAGLEGMTKLKMLCLERARITDEGLKHLEGLTHLKDLRLEGTAITNAGLEHLKGLKQLNTLDLGNTKITDAGLEHLVGLKQLIQLSLSETQVTDTGVAKLQKALPNCIINEMLFPLNWWDESSESTTH